MTEPTKTRSKIWLSIGVIVGVVSFGVFLLDANSQDDGYSKTELTSLKPSSTSEGCASFEATFSSAVKEKPSAMLDIEKVHLVQGAISRLLDAVLLGPDRVKYVVRDKIACDALNQGQQKYSVTVMDGRGADNRPLFPYERSFERK